MHQARTRPLITGLLAAILVLLALAPGASASEYAPPPPKAQVSSTPKAGSSVEITGQTTPLSTVTVTLHSGSGEALYAPAAVRVLGTTVARADGRYSLSVVIPRGLGAGPWFMTVAANGEILSTMAVDSTGAPAAAGTGSTGTPAAAGAGSTGAADTASPRVATIGSGQLPVTGSTTSLLLVLGVGLVAVGGSAVVLTRGRSDAVANG